MTLSDWNKLVEYGKELCTELRLKGYNVILKPYTMYDGRKGLKMQVLDAFGDVYKEYYSGIDNPFMMQTTMMSNARRIIKECK